ncbi:hypothetical protein BP00DRAFT_412436 [Aspergillus indologenus CBS 114.80]|uniref:Uncharacterized protein n=1 Tax=Aspergillus indologenus CBS 114.80 TaxID=1450541 RepID=A0A2V5IEU5_9EURO|nr:hypothetical protein BP00DRAFT_412436 [Aspergillus indologenus CBS 114.80]
MGGSMDTQSAEALSQDYSACTGTDCHISGCVDWNTGQCKPGYSVLDYVHQGSYGMIEDPDTKLCKSGEEGDSDAQYRLICCPTNAMPEGCSWEGELEGMCYGGSMTCGEGKKLWDIECEVPILQHELGSREMLLIFLWESMQLHGLYLYIKLSLSRAQPPAGQLQVYQILLTIRANAIMQSSTGSVDLFSLGFPGMSIKGLISIGPELALYGQMNAFLSISGELNAGIALESQKTEVYFPQDAAGKADSVAPADLNDEQSQTYSFDPTFDATLTAKGNMAFRFGISVLGGDLMSSYVTAGLNNTINLGISAEASYSGGTSSAGFCYWADYVYSLFIRADMSFLDDVAYWGSEYEVASPADPLELVAKTCTTYFSDVDLSKRSDPTSLVANTTGAACFGGLMSCQKIDNSPTASGNLSCPMVCDGDSCTLLDDGAASSSRKRQATTTTAQCARFPAFFYNCAWFGNSYIPNQDQTTNTLPGQQAYLATGICANVQNYLFSHQSQWSPQTMGSNFMLLTYKPDAEDKNRLYACGTKSTNTYTTKSCAQLKRSLWSVEAQDSYAKKGDYEVEPGFSESVSCDEFPSTDDGELFRVAEGGSGASTACAPVEQQHYQSMLNGMVSHIYDKQAKQTWSTESGFTGYTRYFTMNLFNSQDASNPTNWLGTYAGYYDSGETLPLLRVVGGVNLFYSQLWSITSNALCHIDASTQPDLQPLLKIYQFKLEKCQIVYENPYVTGRWKRDNEDTKEDNYTGPDHLHPSLWQVKEIRVSKDWQKRSIHVKSSDLDSPTWLKKMSRMLHDAEPIGNDYHVFTPFNSTFETQIVTPAAPATSDPSKSRQQFERHLHWHH